MSMASQLKSSNELTGSVTLDSVFAPVCGVHEVVL